MLRDYRDVIITKLSVMERGTNNVYKKRAYGNVINQIRALQHTVSSFDDLRDVNGIGKGIRTKISEIFATGTLKAADPPELLQVYGIGIAKARQIQTKYGITTISELRKRLDILNEKQRIGLKYVDDLQLRIPRKEMLMHERLIKRIVATIHPELEIHLVGSFRRQSRDSGDIDVLLRLPMNYSVDVVATTFKQICETMIKKQYIIDVLALGNVKCMGVCKLREGSPARRIDLLITPYHEYPYALLYFTGSGEFNIRMRNVAAQHGYSLSEHGLRKITSDAKDVPMMHTEKDIFDFLEYPYCLPSER